MVGGYVIYDFTEIVKKYMGDVNLPIDKKDADEILRIVNTNKTIIGKVNTEDFKVCGAFTVLNSFNAGENAEYTFLISNAKNFSMAFVHYIGTGEYYIQIGVDI